MFAIDPFLDGRTGYFFEINPSGAMGDGLITGPTGGGGFGGEMNKSWDGIWLARVRRTSLGWTAEIEMPFKTLNFDPEHRHVGRELPAHREAQERREPVDRLAAQRRPHAHVERRPHRRHQDISQGIGLDLKPYLLGAAGNAPGRGTRRTRAATSTSASMRSTT